MFNIISNLLHCALTVVGIATLFLCSCINAFLLVVYIKVVLQQKYVEPIFLRQSREQAEKLARVESGIMELKTGFKTDLQVMSLSYD